MLDLHSIFKNGDPKKRVLDSPTHAHRIRNVCTRTELGNTETSIMLSLARASQVQDNFVHFRLWALPLRHLFLNLSAMLTFLAALSFAQQMGFYSDGQLGYWLLALMALTSTLLEVAMGASLLLQGWLDPIASILDEVSAYSLESPRVWQLLSKLSSRQLLDKRLEPLLAHLQSGVEGGDTGSWWRLLPNPLKLMRQWRRRDTRSRKRLLTQHSTTSTKTTAVVEKAWRRPGGKSRCQRKWQIISEVAPVSTMGVGLPSAPTSWDSTEGCTHLRSVNTERHFRQRASRITRLGRWRSWNKHEETAMDRLLRVFADAHAGAVRGIGSHSHYPLPLLAQPGNCILRALVTIGVISKNLAEEYAEEFPIRRGSPERSYEGIFDDLTLNWSHMSEAVPPLGSGWWLWHRPTHAGRAHCVALNCTDDIGYVIYDDCYRPWARNSSPWSYCAWPVTLREIQLSLLHQDSTSNATSWFLKVDKGCACNSASCEECSSRATSMQPSALSQASAGVSGEIFLEGVLEQVEVALPVDEWDTLCAPGDMRTKKQFPRQVIEWLANKGKLKPNPKGGLTMFGAMAKTKTTCKLGQPWKRSSLSMNGG